MSENNNELIVREETGVQLGTIHTDGPQALIHQASAIASELKKVIDSQNLYSTIQGQKHVKVDGWTTMGGMMGVVPREIPELTFEMEDGGYQGGVELVRVNDGLVVGRATAICGPGELDRNGNEIWMNRPPYARRSMAVTRATGKAFRLSFSWIMTLAGYNPTPYEEMSGVIDANFTENRPKKTKVKKNTEKEPSPITKFWDYAKNKIRMDESTANDILKSQGGDFEKGLQVLIDQHTPPEE